MRVVYGSIILAVSCISNKISAALAATSSWLEPIEIKGYKTFLSKAKNEIQWKGVAYYPRPNSGKYDHNNVDFFGEDYKHVWMSDLDHIQYLGVNLIRIYAVNPAYDVNHDPFFCELSRRGIYVIIGVGATCEGCAIGKEEAPTCYSTSLKTRAEMIIAKFSRYSNVLFIEAGNEVNHAAEGALTNAPCQKALIRDMRRYVERCASSSGMRKVPIGVIVADYERTVNAKYYLCNSGSDKLDSVEWYGINAYLQCDPSAKEYSDASGLQELMSDLKDISFPIPTIFGEFGCLQSTFESMQSDNGTIYEAQRNWLEAKWILEDMSDQFIGGVAFEYSTENANSKGTSAWPYKTFGPQNYGTGYYAPEDCDHDTKHCSFQRMPNYYHLKNAFASAKLESLTKDSFSPDSSRTVAPTCPSEVPALDKFIWPTDAVESIGCPDMTAEKLPQCSEPIIKIDVTATVKPPSLTSPAAGAEVGAQGGINPIGASGATEDSAKGGLSPAVLAGVIVGAALVVSALALFGFRKLRNRDSDSKERRPSKASEWEGYAPVGTPNEDEGILRL